MPLIEELPDDYSGPPPGAWQCSEFASEFEFYEGTEAWDEQAQWDEQDWWEYSDVPADAYQYIRAVRLCDVAPEPLAVCDAECEFPSSSTLCFELDRDDSGDEFFRECEEESARSPPVALLK